MNTPNEVELKKVERNIPEELKGSDSPVVKSDTFMMNWLNLDGTIHQSDMLISDLIRKLQTLKENGESINKIVMQVDICKNEYMRDYSIQQEGE